MYDLHQGLFLHLSFIVVSHLGKSTCQKQKCNWRTKVVDWQLEPKPRTTQLMDWNSHGQNPTKDIV